MKEILVLYLLIINALAFLLMLLDKYKARKNLWRIPEKTLLISALIGGSAGAILGMQFFHHKTRKPKFAVGVPVILVVESVVVWFIQTM